jgi:hypothetical protein
VVLYNDVAKALPTGYLPLLWSKLS